MELYLIEQLEKDGEAFNPRRFVSSRAGRCGDGVETIPECFTAIVYRDDAVAKHAMYEYGRQSHGRYRYRIITVEVPDE